MMTRAADRRSATPRLRIVRCAVMAAFALVGTAASVRSPAASQGLAIASTDGWPLTGRDVQGDRYSPLDRINRSNVAQLGLAWEFDEFLVRGRTHRGVESNPVLVDGTLYFSGPWGVAYAVDARTGKPLWTYDPHPDGRYGRNACCDAVNRGLAVADGMVFTAALDGRLVAVDAKTGLPVWQVDTLIDHKLNYTSTGAPVVADGNVLIGNAGADMGARGYVSAYDVRTGKLAWRFYAVPGNPKTGPDETPEVTFARKTWGQRTRWEFGGGGNDWDAIAYDPALNLVYLGLGNGGPHPRWLRDPGGGDDLFLSSIVAVDAATGRMRWYYQETPGDSWDYAATAPIVLADLKIGGEVRKVLMQAPKNGIFYVLDRETGKLLKADAYTTVTWTDGVDLTTGRPRYTASSDYSAKPSIIWPSAAGGHAWTPMSFNLTTGLVYLHVYDAPMRYTIINDQVFRPGTLTQGDVGAFPPFRDAPPEVQTGPKPSMKGWLKAWDPATARTVWKVGPLPFIGGGTMTTAGGLVFQGLSDGTFSAYDAATGRRLMSIQTGSTITAAPMTYELDGVQYVAVMAGAGGPQGPMYGPDWAASKYRNAERLMVFRLGGRPTPLPPLAMRPPLQPTPAAVPAAAATLKHGEALFRDNCQRCHPAGGAFGEFPNLWNMPPSALQHFEAIVYGGAFNDAGMAAFSDVLSKADVQAIKAFIVSDERLKRAAGQGAGAQAQSTAH